MAMNINMFLAGPVSRSQRESGDEIIIPGSINLLLSLLVTGS